MQKKEERYYFGDYEIYRKFVNGTLDTERTTVNISKACPELVEGTRQK